MDAGRPNGDVVSLGILVAEPFDRLLDLDGALPFSEDHFASVALDTEVKPLAVHCAELHAHQPCHDHGAISRRAVFVRLVSSRRLTRISLPAYQQASSQRKRIIASSRQGDQV